jgi:hypothetical protein
MDNVNWETVNWRLVQNRVSRIQYRIYEQKKRFKRYYLQHVLANSFETKFLAVELTLQDYEVAVPLKSKLDITLQITFETIKNVVHTKVNVEFTNILRFAIQRFLFYILVPYYYASSQFKTFIPFYRPIPHDIIKKIKKVLLSNNYQYAVQINLNFNYISNIVLLSVVQRLLVSPLLGTSIKPYLMYYQRDVYSRPKQYWKKISLPYYEPLKILFCDLLVYELLNQIQQVDNELNLILVPGIDKVVRVCSLKTDTH